jgi:hypothetical protein
MNCFSSLTHSESSAAQPLSDHPAACFPQDLPALLPSLPSPPPAAPNPLQVSHSPIDQSSDHSPSLPLLITPCLMLRPLCLPIPAAPRSSETLAALSSYTSRSASQSSGTSDCPSCFSPPPLTCSLSIESFFERKPTPHVPLCPLRFTSSSPSLSRGRDKKAMKAVSNLICHRTHSRERDPSTSASIVRLCPQQPPPTNTHDSTEIRAPKE